MEIPVDLEGIYGILLKRIVQDVTSFALMERADQRRDQARDLEKSEIPDEALVALLALGLTVEDLLDKQRLRRALRRIAKNLDERTKRSLTQLLGKAVDVDVTGDLDRWIDRQTTVIEALLVSWAAEVGRKMISKGIGLESARGPIGRSVAQQSVEELQKTGSKAERNAFAVASTAILALNAQIVGQNALGAGVDNYIWRTSALSPTGTIDAATREWHADLDGTVQSFNAPPVGGGTGPDDLGNPQEGINCRCVAEVVVG